MYVCKPLVSVLLRSELAAIIICTFETLVAEKVAAKNMYPSQSGLILLVNGSPE